MTDIIEHYVNYFTHAKQSLAGADLPWLKSMRAQSMERFSQLGFPTTRDEAWKYTLVTPITKSLSKQLSGGDLKQAAISSSQTAPSNLKDLFIADDFHRLIFINGTFAKALSSIHALPEQVIIEDMPTALRKYPDLVKTHLNQYAKQIHHGFAALNTALMQSGLYIHLPDNTVIEKPIHIIFLTTESDRSSHLRNLFVLGANSQATVVENYQGGDCENYFTNTITEIAMADNAHFEHIKLQQENSNAFHIGTVTVEQAANSHFVSQAISLGGKLARSEISVKLNGEGAAAYLNGLYIGNGRQHLDQHTQIDHLKSYGTSRELYKGILTDRARGVFRGHVYVHEGATKTDAAQTNKNLLLSDTAEVDTKPQLEIYNDDVKCSHGATIGQLDENALFYLRTRGLDDEAAKTVLVYAFAREIVDRIHLSPIRNYLQGKILHRLEGPDLRNLLCQP